MRSYTCLALVAVSSAFVLPNEQVSFLQHVDQESRHSANEVYSNLPSRSELVDDFKSAFQSVSDDLEGAFDRASDLFEDKFDHYSSKAAEAWDEGLSSAQDAGADIMGRVQQAYQDAQGYATAVADQIEEDSDFGIMGRDHHHHHHHKPNLTVYQIINEAKSTTKLAKLINKFDDLVEALNGTSANFTVFVPPDSVFERIPEDAPKPSKEFLKALLSYHVSPEFYPAGRILVSRTIPSLLKSPALGKKPLPQRLSTNIGLRGLTINYYSRIFKINIFGTNGVIHGVRSFIFPPPSTLKIVELLPSEFSTLELGLRKTGLLKSLNSTKHAGGTFFAPSNGAFARLGPKLNAFLFSDYGLKYLKPLLEYHVAPGATLYSDAFYKATDNGEASEETTLNGVPKGYFHVDLPTLLKDRTLGVDIARYGRFISIKVNGFARVSASDIVAYDGVIQIVPNVLIPPKRLNDGSIEVWDDSKELTEEDLKERLEPFVQQTSFWEDL